MKNKKICIIVSASMNLYSLYKEQFKFLMQNGYDVTAIANNGVEHKWLRDDGIKTKVINFRRKPSPFYDFMSLVKLTWFFLTNRFDIVSISTPKASLIAAIAAFMTRKKNIIYTLRGRAYEKSTGVKRFFYECIERLICGVSSEVFCISHELKRDFILKKLCSSGKIYVIGSGSSNGVDLNKFSLTEKKRKEGLKIRHDLNLADEDILILYSGRIRKDKGINELVYAFKNISNSFSHVHLLLQGEFEYFDPLDFEVNEEIKSNSRIYTKGWTKNVEFFFAGADIFAFPSHREGFGNVAIEASAMELPVVGFNVIGCRESIKDGVSGILCNNINAEDLEKNLTLLINNRDLREKLGSNGRARAVQEFDSEIIWKEILKKYDELTL